MARDRGGPAVAQQILIYPMLDDRTTTSDPAMVPFLNWSYDDNVTGWGALLGSDSGDLSPYAAPARAQDLANLPPTFIDVGDLDIFRDEKHRVRAAAHRGRRSHRIASLSGVPTRL